MTSYHTHPDWTDFRNLESLGRRAGVSLRDIPALLLKELVDNALDCSGTCEFDRLPDGSFFVRDVGTGIAGTDAEIAELFSIARPLTSSKMLRLPTRGALGNGLRVVAGAVLASRGSLFVKTRGRRLQLAPQDDGTTRVVSRRPCRGKDTEITVRLGPRLPVEFPEVSRWAQTAILLASQGTSYRGRSSPWWYTPEAFWEFLQASPNRTVREAILGLEGCGNVRKAGIVAAAYLSRAATSLSREEAADLLDQARKHCQPVNPGRLGAVGEFEEFPGCKKELGSFTQEGTPSSLSAVVPYVIEAWAWVDEEPSITVCVNRTPVPAEVQVFRHPKHRRAYLLHGCSLAVRFTVSQNRDFGLLVNVQTPFAPLTTQGKAPDLRVMRDQLVVALEKAIGRAVRHARSTGEAKCRTKKDVILSGLKGAMLRAGGREGLRYSLRQLFYALRPFYLAALKQEPSYGHFARVITDYERALGQDLPGIYRDTRGILYHPHSKDRIPLGTLTVEAYRRPDWTFNKILYCEKEGLFPILLDDGWPERHDCALLTSKGYASRAARDMLDLLDRSEEPLTFFCIHDADGPGTIIFEALQEETAARAGRKFEIVNFGLGMQEALDMGLDVEPVHRKGNRRVAVARYVSAEEEEWLQQHRVELNAMNTPQFLAWLERKMQAHREKLIPPVSILEGRLEKDVRGRVHQKIVDRVLREAGIDGQVEAACRNLHRQIAKARARLASNVERSLRRAPAAHWSEPVARVADHLVRDVV